LTTIKLIVLVLFTTNMLLFGLEASKPPVSQPAESTAVISNASNIPGIRLISELDINDFGDRNRQCFTIGPFESAETVDAIVEMLTEFASRAGPRETEAFVDRGYWVYLPPYEDEQGARQAIEILYDAGMDVGLISNGEFDNSVSLGYFISQDNARKQRDRVREMGFPAEFKIQREDESRFWVDYEQEAGSEYASRVLADLVPADLHRPTACGPTEADLALRNTATFD
jgi:hypothetical protein